MCPDNKNKEDSENGEHQHLAGLHSKVCQAEAAVSDENSKCDMERMAGAAKKKRQNGWEENEGSKKPADGMYWNTYVL